MKLLKFLAEWCQPCKMQGKLLEGFSGCEVVPVDIEDEANEPLVLQYGIRNLPTLILTDNEGNEIKRFTGLTQPEKITEALEQLT